MSRLYNLPALKVRRRTLKKNLTPAEAKFWSIVKNRGFHGYRWRRQFSVAHLFWIFIVRILVLQLSSTDKFILV